MLESRVGKGYTLQGNLCIWLEPRLRLSQAPPIGRPFDDVRRGRILIAERNKFALLPEGDTQCRTSSNLNFRRAPTLSAARVSVILPPNSDSMNHRPRKVIALGILPFLLAACHLSKQPTPSLSAQSSSDSPYPAHWWAPVPKDGAPAWEILPQEAGPGQVILSKRHELGLLSNFAATPFIFRDKHYASLEGFWQMMLYPEGKDDLRTMFPGLEWKYTPEQVAEMTSFEAKSAGTLAEENMTKMGITWVTFEGQQIEHRPVSPCLELQKKKRRREDLPPQSK
jgi:hypothetical protein